MELKKITLDDILDLTPETSYFDSFMFQQLKDSVERHGQLLPVFVVREGEKYKPVAGRFLLKAMRDLNVFVASCYVLTSKADEISVYLKEIAFPTNYIAMSKHILDCEKTPYDETMAKKLQEIANFDWQKINKPANPDQVTLF